MISFSGNTCVKNAGAPTRYGAVAQTLHWLTAILVLGAYLSSVGGPESRIYSDALEPTRRLHETLGLAVFAVVALRLIWRVFDRRPAEPTMPRWIALASRVTQFALYMLLVAVPVTAIVGAWCEGHPLTLLGAIGAGPWHALICQPGPDIDASPHDARQCYPLGRGASRGRRSFPSLCPAGYCAEVNAAGPPDASARKLQGNADQALKKVAVIARIFGLAIAVVARANKEGAKRRLSDIFKPPWASIRRIWVDLFARGARHKGCRLPFVHGFGPPLFRDTATGDVRS